MKNSYERNMYNYLKRKGLSQKYEHAGIYCIKIDNEIVYIGKSDNMLRRVAEHYVGIQKQNEKKYRILAEAQRKGHPITFDVLYYAQNSDKRKMFAEIGEKEGDFIRSLSPCLNTQIPKKENWKTWDINDINAQNVLTDILK